MKLKTLFAIGFAFLFACSPLNNTEIISVDIDPERTIPDSILLADREIITLETTPGAILSTIIGIDIYKDKLYILDIRKEQIFVFDKTGTFKSAIGRQGRGPGEYGRISDFCIDRDNDQIIITTDRPNKIIYFSLSGKFIGETFTEDIIYEIVKKDNKLYCRLFDENHEFAIYELEGHSVKSVKYPDIPKIKRIPGVIISPLGRMVNASEYGILFTRTFDNTIYKVTNDELIPFKTIDFGKYYVHDANILERDELMQRVDQDRIVYGITNARLIGENRIIFNGFPNGIFVIDGNTAQQYGSLMNQQLVFGHTDMVPISDPETDYIAFSHSASQFEYLSLMYNGDYTEDVHRLSELTLDDNPVIFLYKLK